MPIQWTSERPNVNNRRIINGEDADVIQLFPLKHPFAWDAYHTGNANHWLPTEVNMQNDVEQWRSNNVLTDEERHAFKTVLGFFTTADSIAANNLVIATYRHITSPEVRMFLLRQAYEEAIHTQAYQHIVQTLGIDEGEIFNMYREVEAIYNKDAFILSFNEGVFDKDFKTGTPEADQKFLENMIIFSLVMEGIFFYSSFAVILGFQRQNKLPGSAEQIQYIMRDESAHLNFGIDLINAIKEENPHLWTQEFQDHIAGLIRHAVELEYTFASTVFPKGIFGLTADGFRQYIQYIADKRLNAIGIPSQYNSENPFPWMSEAIDLRKEKNFFETRVTEYQTGGSLEW